MQKEKENKRLRFLGEWMLCGKKRRAVKQEAKAAGPTLPEPWQMRMSSLYDALCSMREETAASAAEASECRAVCERKAEETASGVLYAASAERTRLAAESQRGKNEKKRKQQEQSRQFAESGREEREALRETAEKQRELNEMERILRESVREDEHLAFAEEMKTFREYINGLCVSSAEAQMYELRRETERLKREIGALAEALRGSETGENPER